MIAATTRIDDQAGPPIGRVVEPMTGQPEHDHGDDADARR